MQSFFYQVETTLGPLWPVLVFVLILLVGYVVAKVIESVVRGALRRTTLDDKLFGAVSDRPGALSSESIGGKIAFWVIMVLALIAAFNAVDLGDVGGPLGEFVGTIIAFIPNLIAALVLALVAYAVAKILSAITTKALQAADVDRRVAEAGGPGARAEPTTGTVDVPRGSGPAGEVGPGAQRDLDDAEAHARARLESGSATDPDRVSLSESLGTAVFYFVLLLFLPAILGTLELGGILAPVQNLVNEVLSFLPNLLLAGIILLVGAFVARILRKIVSNLLAATGVNALSERVGLARATGGTRLSDLIGLVVYILVLIPVIVAALNALDVEAVTAPASAMLAQFLEAIPRLFVAALILGIAFVVGRLVASLVSSLLAGVGFDRLFEGLGFRTASREARQPTEPGAAAQTESLDTRSPSGLVGWVVLVAVMLFAATEAASSLGLDALAVLIAEFTVLAGQVLLGLVIFALGLYLANLAYSSVKSSGTSQSETLAVAARVSILVFAGAMALKQMGLADSIVNLAFGLVLGAIALAAAIAFGWGGRDVAREQLEKMRDAAQQDGAPRALKPQAGAPGTGSGTAAGSAADAASGVVTPAEARRQSGDV